MDQSTGRGRVLVMESDGLIRNLVSLMLRTAGYQVDSAATGAEALHKLRRLPPALAVIGLGEVLAGGWQLLEALRQAPLAPPVVAITALHQCGPAKRAGATACLPLPFPAAELLSACEAATRQGLPHGSAELC